MSEPNGNGNGAKYSHLYTYSGANKAGMEGIDKEKQAQIIYDMSKDSAYFKRAAKLDAETDLKVQVMKQTLASFKGATEQRIRESVHDRCLELERRRSFDRICCVLDMDMFYAAVEIRDQPQLKDLPVAVGGMSMISTANYVARKYGVRAAIPGFIARKLCPQLVFVGCNFDKYKLVSDQVKDIIREYDPHFSSHSLDEVYFDLTRAATAVWCGLHGYATSASATEQGGTTDMQQCECEAVKEGSCMGTENSAIASRNPDYLISRYPYCTHTNFENIAATDRPNIMVLRAHAVALLQEIRARITTVTKGLTCSAGIANNFYLAKICADVNKPNGQYELSATREAVLRFVSELPTRKVGGIGKVTERMLERLLEIKTMQQVRDCLAQLVHTCTPVLVQFLMRTSLGIGSEEGCGEEAGAEGGEEGAGGGGGGGKKRYLRKSLGCERTYSAKGICDADELHARLHKICCSVGEDMTKDDLNAKAVTLKLKNVDFELSTRIATSSSYFQSAEAIEALARPLLDEALPMKVRLMGVSVSKFKHAEEAVADPKQRGILSFLSGPKPECKNTFDEPAEATHEDEVEEEARLDGQLEDRAGMLVDLAAEGAGGSDDGEEGDHGAITADIHEDRVVHGFSHGAPSASSAHHGRHDKSAAEASGSFLCPVCSKEVAGSLHVFNAHLDRCLGVDGTQGSSSSSAGKLPAISTSSGLASSLAMQGNCATSRKRPAHTSAPSMPPSRKLGTGSAASALRPAVSHGSRSDALVLGITDFFALKKS